MLPKRNVQAQRGRSLWTKNQRPSLLVDSPSSSRYNGRMMAREDADRQPEWRILVVDDDPEMRGLIMDALEPEGYAVYGCGSGEQAVNILTHEAFDVILGDFRMPPGMTGLELLAEVRRLSTSTKFILMTNYGTPDTILQVLRGEGNDYLQRPFSLYDLRESIRRVMGHRPAASDGMRRSGDMILDSTKFRVHIGPRTVNLAPRDFAVLVYLFDHRGRFVTAEELLREVWERDDPDNQSAEAVRMCIFRLRKKIETDPSNPCCILSERGRGYQLYV